MKPASFGFASEDGTGNVLRFCSQSCKAFERESPIKEPAFATSDLHHQLFIEIFVSNDGQPAITLPYAVNETAINMFEMLRKTRQVEYFISLALSSKGIPNL